MRVTSPRSCGPRPKGIRPLQGRGTSVALSGGVAPGYYLVPLQGTKNLPLGLTPRHPVSDITDSPFRLCMLIMTAWETSAPMSRRAAQPIRRKQRIYAPTCWRSSPHCHADPGLRSRYSGIALLFLGGKVHPRSPQGIHTDRGREDRVVPFPPPSEPDGRISRIRLSSRWFYLRED
jgi:hypothetical protein